MEILEMLNAGDLELVDNDNDDIQLQYSDLYRIKKEYKQMMKRPTSGTKIIKYIKKYPNRDCSLCLSSLSNKRRKNVITNCSKNHHIFHEKCIFDLFSTPTDEFGYRLCPECRQKISLYAILKKIKSKKKSKKRHSRRS